MLTNNFMYMKRLLLSLLSIAGCCLSAAAQQPAYLDPSRPVATRVADLLSRLTLEEKVYQMMNNTPAIPRLQIPEYN